MKQLRWAKTALADLKRLDRNATERIVSKVKLYATTGHGDARLLKVRDGVWRLAVGNWRVLFTSEKNVLVVRRIRSRGSAYRP